MITLNKIKKYVNNRLNTDIEKNTRERNVVYAKAVFANLALKHIKKISLQTIGKVVNRDHATIMHYRDEILETIRINEPYIYDVYLEFDEKHIELTENEQKLTNDYNKLYRSYIDTKIELSEVKRKLSGTNEIKEFLSVLNSVPNDKLDLFLFRIKPIAKMLNSHVIH